MDTDARGKKGHVFVPGDIVMTTHGRYGSALYATNVPEEFPVGVGRWPGGRWPAIVCRFSLGMIIASTKHNGDDFTHEPPIFYVLDSITMQFGWVHAGGIVKD